MGQQVKAVTAAELVAAFKVLRGLLLRVWKENRDLRKALKLSQADNDTIVVINRKQEKP